MHGCSVCASATLWSRIRTRRRRQWPDDNDATRHWPAVCTHIRTSRPIVGVNGRVPLRRKVERRRRHLRSNSAHTQRLDHTTHGYRVGRRRLRRRKGSDGGPPAVVPRIHCSLFISARTPHRTRYSQ